MSRILGIDPGTRKVGYAVLDVPGPGRYDYVECGILQLSAKAALSERLRDLVADLTAVIAEFRPRCLALETAFYGQNAQSALKLGQARGAIVVLAAQQGLEIFEYAPAKVKRVVTGHGRASKADIAARVSLLCKLSRPPSADAADALALALCHGQIHESIREARRP